MERISQPLHRAAAAKKCHGCGCFHDAVATLGASDLASALADPLKEAEATLGERRYDCLACEVCWPADALNAAAEIIEVVATGCGAEVPVRGVGWPPYPGDYRVVRHAAPVAVCTLHSRSLVDEVVEAAPQEMAIVGSLQTENLGIERLVENVVANPHIRFLLLCGEETGGRVGHFPGQSLLALMEHGLDTQGRIVGARGKRPVLRNVDRTRVEHFRRQVEVADHRGLIAAAQVAERVEELAARDPGPSEPASSGGREVRVVRARPPGRLVLDPAGYVVVYPDPRRHLLVAEHYENGGLLRTVIEGGDAIEVMATLLRDGLITRLDHAAYLGRELTLAERALEEGTPYIQDRAPEGGAVVDPAAHGCAPGCDCDDASGES